MTVNYWLALGLACSLSACTTLPVPTPAEPATAEALWQQRQPPLTAVQHWTVSGPLAILTPQTGWHVRIRWQQQGDAYLIQLDAPLGQGAAELRGDTTGVVLRTAGGEFHAASAEDLLTQRLGWRLPAGGLHYWVRGLPDAGAAVDGLTLDAAGRLTHLQQSGWNIEFRHYSAVPTSTSPLALPDKIFLTHNSTPASAALDLRLVIEQWDTTPH